MITQGLLSIVFGLVNALLMPLEIINFTVDLTKLQPVKQFFMMAAYLIPFEQLTPIFAFFCLLMGFRIVVSLIKTIWDLLPIL